MSSDPEKPKASGPPESPTTARELDFDDESAETQSSPTPKSSTSASTQMHIQDEAPPPKPPRPLNPQQQAEATLKEAFPSIDMTVIKAVLRASGGNVEPAFNALLEMTDPEAQQREPTPPPQPPRRAQTAATPTTTAQSQLAADEQYARQLAEHYDSTTNYDARPPGAQRGGYQQGRPRQRQNVDPRYDAQSEERERSFIDDDLPEIRDNIKKGFLETQSKVSSWVTNLRKKIDGDDDEEFQDQPVRTSNSKFGFNSQPSYGGRRSGEFGRRSSERDRYDADPQVLGDDFAGLQMRDNDLPPRSSSRPKANPDLFKPMPRQPSANGRKVSFQDGPPEEIGVTGRASPNPPANQSSTAKASKWQPMTSVEPSPVTDHDPFSLGDSDDEEPKKAPHKEEKSSEVSLDKGAPDTSAITEPKPASDQGEQHGGEAEKLVVKS